MVNTYYTDGIMPRDSYGDWCVPPEEPELIHSNDPKRITSGVFLGTAFFIHMTDLMEKYASILNNRDDVNSFAEKKDTMIDAFNRHFLDINFGTYSNNSATCNILVLAFYLVPPELRDQMINNLIHRIAVLCVSLIKPTPDKT